MALWPSFRFYKHYTYDIHTCFSYNSTQKYRIRLLNQDLYKRACCKITMSNFTVSVCLPNNLYNSCRRYNRKGKLLTVFTCTYAWYARYLRAKQNFSVGRGGDEMKRKNHIKQVPSFGGTYREPEDSFFEVAMRTSFSCI